MKKENENIYDISAIGDMPDIGSMENEEREPEEVGSECSESSENSESSDDSDDSEGEDEPVGSEEESGETEKEETLEKDPEEDEPEAAGAVGEIASNLMEAACKILRGEMEGEELEALKDAVYARMAIEKLKMEMAQAVEEAYRQGEIAGRNATIEIEADMPEDLVPNLVGTPLPTMRNAEASIFDLARQARSCY